MLASAACASAAAALVLLPMGASGATSEALPKVRLAGQDIPLTAEGDAVALDAVRKYAQGAVTVVLAGSDKRTVARSALGAEIDRVRLRELLAEARNPESAMRRAAPSGVPLVLPIPVVLRREAGLATLLKLKDELDRAPVDARFDLESKRLLSEQHGVWFDVFGTLAKLEGALSQGESEVQAAYDAQLPRLASDQMGSVTFGEVLGWFETRYNTDQKHEARTFNLRLAASKLDGHVILPGETFDFNEVVGPRDEANGYKVAPVIAQGELVDGIGGGTCQIAGTLHSAAFFAGLDIVERHPHTRPSFYIKMGLDATVVYPTITLRLRNPFDHPVVLHETVRDGVVRAEILGPKRNRTVTFVRKIDDVVPFAEIERPDPKLAKGVRVLAQRGIPGFRTHRYRVVRDGPFAVRERWNDSYPPTNQIIRVGTGDAAETEAVDDPHPEYVADEYLVLLQGPDVKGTVPSSSASAAVGGMAELREAGKTGERGWTERAGFSRYVATRKADQAACTGDCPPEVALRSRSSLRAALPGHNDAQSGGDSPSAGTDSVRALRASDRSNDRPIADRRARRPHRRRAARADNE